VQGKPPARQGLFPTFPLHLVSRTSRCNFSLSHPLPPLRRFFTLCSSCRAYFLFSLSLCNSRDCCLLKLRLRCCSPVSSLSSSMYLVTYAGLCLFFCASRGSYPLVSPMYLLSVSCTSYPRCNPKKFAEARMRASRAR
jgi:hypothetical protein